MKKIALSAAALLLAAASQAQLTKGRILLGGSANFSSSENTSSSTPFSVKSKSNNFNIGPTAGLFVRDNLMAGVSLGYSQAKNSNDANDATFDGHVYSASVLLRRYFPIGGRFYFQLEGGLGYSHSETRSYQNVANDWRNSGNSVGAGVSPGLSFAFGKHLLFETGLSNLLNVGYNSTTTKDGAGTILNKQSGFGAGIGAGGTVPLNIGFNILLGH